MIPDLSPVFSRYEQLRAEADAIFASVRQRFPDCVTCKKGCSDCCHALFDLSLVEAIYLKQAFTKTFDYGATRSEILSRASETDRKLTKIKRDLFRLEKDGMDKESIMQKAGEIRMRCPLLGSDDECLLYEARPITCRLYGIPTTSGHVCGFSNFAPGISYPAVQLEKIQARLEAMSRDIQELVHSRFTELDQVYVPVSMALLTDYSEEYLGIVPEKR